MFWWLSATLWASSSRTNDTRLSARTDDVSASGLLKTFEVLLEQETGKNALFAPVSNWLIPFNQRRINRKLSVLVECRLTSTHSRAVVASLAHPYLGLILRPRANANGLTHVGQCCDLIKLPLKKPTALSPQPNAHGVMVCFVVFRKYLTSFRFIWSSFFCRTLRYLNTVRLLYFGQRIILFV